MRVIFILQSSPMLSPLTTLLAAFSSIFRSRAALELKNLALRHQIGVLLRSSRKRSKLTSGDRLLCICLSRLWPDWRSALAIVKPETVIAWHRAGFRLFWTWKVRRGQPGRPVPSLPRSLPLSLRLPVPLPVPEILAALRQAAPASLPPSPNSFCG
jgi:putative transposase